MTSSPVKRRRTSPTTAVNVNAWNTDLEVKPPNTDRNSAGYASYMSPTKASLARLHASLLSSNDGDSASPRSKGKLLLQQRSFVLNASQGINDLRPPDQIGPITYPTADVGGPGPGASPPSATVDADDGDMGIPDSQIDAVVSRGSLDHQIDQPKNGEAPHPSTPVKSRTHDGNAAEPRLPSTPRQLGLEPPASKPNGDLSSSPNRNTKRRRTASAKSSPLKPKEAAIPPKVVETQDEAGLGPRHSFIDFAAKGGDPLSEAGQTTIENNEASPASFTGVPMKNISELALDDPLSSMQSSLILCASDVMTSSPISPIDARGQRFRDVKMQSEDNAFQVRIRLYLKPTTDRVASVDVLQLSLPGSSELGAWLRAPITDRIQVAIIQAVTRYWDMAETRAFCWHQSGQDFGHLLYKTTSNTTVDEEPANLEEDNDITGTQGALFGPTIRLLCDKSLCFSDGVVSLHVTWAIRFTPSGEVTSVLSARTETPANWVVEDDQNDLSRTDEVFLRLIASGKSVHEAIRCIVDVMFPD